jgi:4-amino-4-deoxy-L-arabinose transferase-like glycosyltransferase
MTMSRGVPTAAPPPLAPVVWALALGKLALHLVFINGYGWFRDEFYYIACSQHLDWGYVDHPPLIAVVTAAVRATLGDSRVALRLLPALAGAATVIAAGTLARDMGARRWGQALAALAVLTAPVYLSLHHILTMNAFEPLAWTVFAWLALRAAASGRLATWIWTGVVAGLGLQMKHSMAFMGAALAFGLALSPARQLFLRRGVWISAAIAGAIALPNLIWQIAHGWPTLEFMRNAQRFKNEALPVGRFVVEQLMMMNPAAAIVWGAGLIWLLARRSRRSAWGPGRPAWSALGWAYVVLFALFVATGGKPYYLAPFYPMLFAAGGAGLDALLDGRAWTMRAARAAIVAAVVLTGAIAAPLGLPILPVETFVAYASRLGVTPSSGERHARGRLPQIYADMMGWRAMVDAVTRAAEALPPPEREKAVILVGNYGEAGAINFLGRGRGAPRAISGHNNYWLWGPDAASSEVLLILGGEASEHGECGSLQQVGTVECGDCMPYENHQPIWVCRDLPVSFEEIWPGEKHYN